MRRPSAKPATPLPACVVTVALAPSMRRSLLLPLSDTNRSPVAGRSARPSGELNRALAGAALSTMPGAALALPASRVTAPVARLAALMAWFKPSLKKSVAPLALSTASRGELSSALVPAAPWLLPDRPAGEPRSTVAAHRERCVGVGVGVEVGVGGALGEGEALGEAPGEGVTLGVGEGESVGHTTRRTACPVLSTTSTPAAALTARPMGALRVAKTTGPLAMPTAPVPASVATALPGARLTRRSLLPDWSATTSCPAAASSARPVGSTKAALRPSALSRVALAPLPASRLVTAAGCAAVSSRRMRKFPLSAT
jgi:hypothetical protein